MDFLNYHHLRYFHAIATEGTLTGAASLLQVSQSALSIQLKKLEESLNCPLFSREHKSLVLTEEGRMVYDYAQTIFSTGDELMATLQNRSGKFRDVLRVGAVATLSKNFQISFLREVLADDSIEVIIRSASLRELLGQLSSHTIDLVLSNTPIQRDHDLTLHSQLVAEQPVSLVAPPKLKTKKKFQFPKDLQNTPLVLPSLQSNIRATFDMIMERSGIHPLIAAEADDMAMLRLIARENYAITLVPPVVVQDELKSGNLIELAQIPEIKETFYAITATRRYPNPLIKKLLEK
jgi:LysR family transcriptional activator of nhaA